MAAKKRAVCVQLACDLVRDRGCKVGIIAQSCSQLVQRILNISTRCGSNFTWTPVSSQSWLQVSAVNGRLVVQAAPGVLPSGDYSATVTLQTSPNVGSLQIPVNLHVRDSIATQFFPVISR